MALNPYNGQEDGNELLLDVWPGMGRLTVAAHHTDRLVLRRRPSVHAGLAAWFVVSFVWQEAGVAKMDSLHPGTARNREREIWVGRGANGHSTITWCM